MPLDYFSVETINLKSGHYQQYNVQDFKCTFEFIEWWILIRQVRSREIFVYGEHEYDIFTFFFYNISAFR